jgi:hypothetical protein
MLDRTPLSEKYMWKLKTVFATCKAETFLLGNTCEIYVLHFKHAGRPPPYQKFPIPKIPHTKNSPDQKFRHTKISPIQKIPSSDCHSLNL